MGPEQPRLEGPVRPLRPEVPAVLAGLVLPSRREALADPVVPVRPLHPQVPAVLAGLVLLSRLETLADPAVPVRPLHPQVPEVLAGLVSRRAWRPLWTGRSLVAFCSLRSRWPLFAFSALRTRRSLVALFGPGVLANTR